MMGIWSICIMKKDELVDVLLTDQYAACVFQNQDGGWVKMYDQRESR